MNDVEMFMNILKGDDPVEAYVKSKEGKKEILINSSIMATMQILVDKKIVTNDELDKYQQDFEKLLKDKMKDEYKKTLKKDE